MISITKVTLVPIILWCVALLFEKYLLTRLISLKMFSRKTKGASHRLHVSYSEFVGELLVEFGTNLYLLDQGSRLIRLVPEGLPFLRHVLFCTPFSTNKEYFASLSQLLNTIPAGLGHGWMNKDKSRFQIRNAAFRISLLQIPEIQS